MQYRNHTLRHELKYYISEMEYLTLRARLLPLVEHDENASDGSYHIRSLYFDDMYNTALSEKESGVMFREKYRIRIYNIDDKVIKLEKKSKYSEYIDKSSASLTRENVYSIINKDDISFLYTSPNQVERDMFIAIKTRLLAPAVIVDYEREPFIMDQGNVRITFDKNLQAGIDSYDIFSKDIITVNVLPPGLLILEVKYDDYIPTKIKDLIQIATHNRSAISKYVLCRRIQEKLQTKIQL